MKIKSIVAISLAMISLLSLTGCDVDSTYREEEQYTDDIKGMSIDIHGFPAITNFNEYGLVKDLYEVRDDPDLIMYWYLYNEFTGKLVYQGECIGYGIPAGISITAPEVDGYDTQTLPQAEPNGLYTNGVTTSATWIMAVTTDGEVKPEYVELPILVTQEKKERRLCDETSLPENY